MQLTIYLSGEIHSDWREQIANGINEHHLPVAILAPVTNHSASDNIGADVLGVEQNNFWKDHKAAKINSIRIKNAIEKADVVVVRFGEQYRQWNAAFEAGYAVARGKQLITLHPAEFTHALKEVDASAVATAETPQQVVEILKYVTTQE